MRAFIVIAIALSIAACAAQAPAPPDYSAAYLCPEPDHAQPNCSPARAVRPHGASEVKP